MKGRLLIVDDEEMKRTALRAEAEKRGYEAEDAPHAVEGLERVRASYFDIVITDLRMPRMDGLTFLKRILEVSPDTTVLIMTAYGTVENAVEAMRAGARDYLLKPFSSEELFLRIGRIMEYREALALNRAFLGQVGEGYAFHKMVGRSSAMQTVFRSIARAAGTPATVLLTGETGTGKELAAEAIHHFSDRKGGPLVKVSCATLARDVMESELFGHAKGAFTGALRDHRGRFELAAGGTFLLDDVDDIRRSMSESSRRPRSTSRAWCGKGAFVRTSSSA
jgi:DNA-binding NtrC family response regulator